MARSILAIALAAALGGCVVIGDADQPISAIHMPAPVPGATPEAVVVLPGFGDRAEAMRDFGAAVQRAWPQADVLLTNATFAYYQEGALVPRLEQDVIGPARKRYARVWLAGASMGGAGVVLYKRAHPGQLDGLLLFAPFLGDEDLLEEVSAAGGVRKWEPGPRPAAVDGDNYQREMWRAIKDWSREPALARRVWLVCGKSDKLLAASRLAAAAVPAAQYFEVEGGHKWVVWAHAVEATLPRLRGAT